MKKYIIVLLLSFCSINCKNSNDSFAVNQNPHHPNHTVSEDNHNSFWEVIDIHCNLISKNDKNKKNSLSFDFSKLKTLLQTKIDHVLIEKNFDIEKGDDNYFLKINKISPSTEGFFYIFQEDHTFFPGSNHEFEVLAGKYSFEELSKKFDQTFKTLTNVDENFYNEILGINKYQIKSELKTMRSYSKVGGLKYTFDENPVVARLSYKYENSKVASINTLFCQNVQSEEIILRLKLKKD